jgi:heavy metal sensor kinase
MKISSLRARFATWTALLILLVLVIFGVYVYFRLAGGLYASLDDSLRVSASQIIASLNVDNGKLILSDSVIEAPEEDTFPAGFSVRILTPGGQVLQQSGLYISQMPPLEKLSGSPFYTTLSNPALRNYTAPVTDNSRLVAVVQVARTTSGVRETLGRLLTILLLATPLLALSAAASGYLLASRALRPIDVMTRTARRISAEDLSARLKLTNTDDELGRLASTFDEMLERLEDSFRRERQFTADASHELRTPLAAMQAILSVTRQRRRKPAEYEQALDDLAEETERLRGLTESLLALARADLHPPAPVEAVELSILLEDVTESMRPLADAKGLKLTCKTAGDLTIWGERESLIRLFINLLDNAIKYTRHGGVDVCALCEGEQIHIEVSDTGIGIQPEHLAHIFQRFYRVDPSRSQRGTGLGLSLAQQIVQAHGGRIDANSVPGKGTTFVIQLPARTT